MDIAFAEAEAALTRGEVPVGRGDRQGPGLSSPARATVPAKISKRPTAHAEILAIREACPPRAQLRKTPAGLRPPNVTLEPCAMCAAATIVCAHQAALFW